MPQVSSIVKALDGLSLTWRWAALALATFFWASFNVCKLRVLSFLLLLLILTNKCLATLSLLCLSRTTAWFESVIVILYYLGLIIYLGSIWYNYKLGKRLRAFTRATQEAFIRDLFKTSRIGWLPTAHESKHQDLIESDILVRTMDVTNACYRSFIGIFNYRSSTCCRSWEANNY